MQVYGPFRIQTAAPLGGANRISGKTAEAATGSRSAESLDQLDISAAAQAAMEARDPSSVGGSEGLRWDRINELRQQIASGSYETPERLDAALDRLMDQLG
jgi:negative regulator of flagellin synthesis FlgM